MEKSEMWSLGGFGTPAFIDTLQWAHWHGVCEETGRMRRISVHPRLQPLDV
jgi:hypothetical protein